MAGEAVPADHETAALADYQKRLGQYALFEELMIYVDKGECSFEEAVDQYKHDLGIGGE